MPRKQCAKCPWKVTTNPHDIPRGYCVRKHAALRSTIRSGPESVGGALRIMACHETHEEPCVGWLAHQLGPGNNLGLRLAVSRGQISADVVVDGDQHPNFESTLPDPSASP